MFYNASQRPCSYVFQNSYLVKISLYLDKDPCRMVHGTGDARAIGRRAVSVPIYVWAARQSLVDLNSHQSEADKVPSAKGMILMII